MKLTADQYAHDLKRNVSAVLAGATILLRKTAQTDPERQSVLREMSQQCEATLNLLDKLFKEIEIKTKREEK